MSTTFNQLVTGVIPKALKNFSCEPLRTVSASKYDKNHQSRVGSNNTLGANKN